MTSMRFLTWLEKWKTRSSSVAIPKPFCPPPSRTDDFAKEILLQNPAAASLPLVALPLSSLKEKAFGNRNG